MYICSCGPTPQRTRIFLLHSHTVPSLLPKHTEPRQNVICIKATRQGASQNPYKSAAWYRTCERRRSSRLAGRYQGFGCESPLHEPDIPLEIQIQPFLSNWTTRSYIRECKRPPNPHAPTHLLERNYLSGSPRLARLDTNTKRRKHMHESPKHVDRKHQEWETGRRSTIRCKQ